MKKLLSITLTLAMVLSLMSVTSITASAASEGSLGTTASWSFDSKNGVLTISGSGAIPDYEASYDEHLEKFVASGRPWDAWISSIKKIVIQEGITRIGSYAFMDATSLEDLTLPATLKECGVCTFDYCTQLELVHCPSDWRNSWNGIWGHVLFDENYFGSDVELGQAFLDYGSHEVSYYGQEPNDLLWNLNTETGRFTLTGLGKMYEGYRSEPLPTIDYRGPAKWYNLRCFSKSIFIAEGITSISFLSFKNAKHVTEITLPSTVKKIDSYAFGGCSGIQDIYYLGTEAEWKKVSVSAEGNTDFLKAKVHFLPVQNHTHHLELHDGVCPIYLCTECGKQFWDEKGLKPIDTPFGNYEGMIWNIDKSGLLSISADETYTASYDYGFYPWRWYKDSVTLLQVDGSMTVIPQYAFCNFKKLSAVQLNEGITTIEYYAFWWCENLTSVELPNSILEIDSGAFNECNQLSYQEYKKGRYLGNSKNPYLVLTRMDWDVASFSVHPSTKVIGEYAFGSCDSLTEVTIPNGIISIGAQAFYNCTALTSITIPVSVTYAGSSPFYGCDSLTKAVIEDGATSVVDSLFSGCGSLTSVTIPDSVTSIGMDAFQGCESLTSITIPDGVTIIGECAFEGCESLTSITIPDGVTTIDWCAFSDCTSLASITIPDSVTSVGSGAFQNTAWYDQQPDGLIYIGKVAHEYKGECPESVVIKDGTVSIGRWAFFWTPLRSITIPGSVTNIEYGAFEECNSLMVVCYDGTPDDRNKMIINDGNDCLLNATWVYGDAGGNGDADGDGEITMKDVLKIRKFIAGVGGDLDKDATDVDGDGELTMKDVLMIRKFIAGLIDHLGNLTA